MDQGEHRPEFARVKNRLKDANGRPIGVATDNPILYSRMYEVEYFNGYVSEMAANVFAENLFVQFDQEGNRFLLIEYIIETRTNGTQTLEQDVFFITKRGTKQSKIQLKDKKSASNGWEYNYGGASIRVVE